MRKAAGLEYEVHGRGEPVLLIHGSHVADGFLPLAREAALTDRYRLIRYHRRGFAGSDRASAPFGIDGQAGDARALLQELDVGRAHVVGHSYGAVIALQLAVQAPSAVRSLALLEPPKTTEPMAAMDAFEP
jgi:pimeloyl-ACP methyl ester carboxylesterase